MSLQEAEEVVYAFKLSLELYERAITFDISYPGNYTERCLKIIQ